MLNVYHSFFLHNFFLLCYVSVSPASIFLAKYQLTIYKSQGELDGLIDAYFKNTKFIHVVHFLQ